MIKNLSLGKKMILGFGIVLCLLICISSIAVYRINADSESFSSYRNLAEDANLMGIVQSNMLMIRMNVKDFIITGNSENIRQYEDYVEKTNQYMDRALKEIQDPTRARMVRQTEGHLLEYQKSFEKIKKVREVRNKLVYDVLDVNGPFMEKTLTKILKSARKDNDMTASYQAAITLRGLLLGRLYMTKFLDTNSPKDRDRVRQEFKTLKKEFDILDDKLQNRQRRKWLKELVKSKKEYLSAFEELQHTIFTRNTIVSDSLGKVGPMVTKDTDEIKLSVKKDQEKLGDEINEENKMVVIALVIISIIAFVLGCLVTFVMTRIIVSPVNAAVNFADSIAMGDLSKKMDFDSKDEIGHLVNSLNKMVKTLELKEKMAKEVSDGNLTVEVTLLSEHDGLGKALHGMKENLANIIRSIQSGTSSLAESLTGFSKVATEITDATTQMSSESESVSTAVSEITTGIETLAASNSEMNVNIQSIAATSTQISQNMEDISGSMDSLSTVIHDVSEKSGGAREVAQKAIELSEQSSNKMTELSKSMHSIGEFSLIIKEIAQQTNLLALNANIEAASAGEAGKGFAVVANEIKELANQSSRSAENISTTITEVQKNTEDSARLIGNVGDIIANIDQATTEISELSRVGDEDVNMMVTNLKESVTGVNGVSKLINEISAATDESAKTSEEFTCSAKDISSNMQTLNQVVNQIVVSMSSAQQEMVAITQTSDDLKNIAGQFKL